MDDLGLNMFDFNARFYDAALGRTSTHDPHSDGYYNLSPYSWVGNNPISSIDPDGKDFGDIIKGFKQLPNRIKVSDIGKGFKELGNRIGDRFKAVVNSIPEIGTVGKGPMEDTPDLPAPNPEKTQILVDVGEVNELMETRPNKTFKKSFNETVTDVKTTGKGSKDSRVPHGENKAGQNTNGPIGEALTESNKDNAQGNIASYPRVLPGDSTIEVTTYEINDGLKLIGIDTIKRQQ